MFIGWIFRPLLPAGQIDSYIAGLISGALLLSAVLGPSVGRAIDNRGGRGVLAQMIPSDVDGAAEEGTPFVPAHGMRRISFVPTPSGFRFYHTHVVAGADLNRGTYTGQVGPVYIEQRNNPGAYDREIFLVMKEFEPAFSHGGDMATDALAGAPVKELERKARPPTMKRRRRRKASR